MNDKRFNMKEPKSLSFLFAIIAFLFFVLASVLKQQHALSVVLTVFAALFLVAGGLSLYTAQRKSTGRKNFFLYDRRRNIRIAEADMTFSFVNDNLTYYFSPFFQGYLELWKKMPRALVMQLQAEEAFAPLLALKLLHETSLQKEEDILPLFLSADAGVVTAVCRYLLGAGEKELSEFLWNLKINAEAQSHRVAPFFLKNKRFFEGKILSYIKNNLSEFYFDE